MKKFLPALLLLISVSVSAQNKLFEKIGIGHSFYSKSDHYSEGGYNSRLDVVLGLLMMNQNKKVSFRKELEFELFLIRGSEDSGGLGGGSTIDNLRGYSFVSVFKLLPMVKLNKQTSFFIGPVVGSNLKAHWQYSTSWWVWHGGSGGGKVSRSADEYFSRLFYGIEGGFSLFLKSKNSDKCRIEISSFNYLNFSQSVLSKSYFNRYGFKASLVNPIGLIFRNKKLGKE